MKRPQGPPPWDGSLGDQGRSGDAALSLSGPAALSLSDPDASSKDRTTSEKERAVSSTVGGVVFCVLGSLRLGHCGGKRKAQMLLREGGEQAGAQIRSPRVAATSSKTPTTSGPAAVV